MTDETTTTLTQFESTDTDSDTGSDTGSDADSEPDSDTEADTEPDTETEATDATAADELYHPENEWDELTDTSLAGGIDGGRKANLDAVRNKPSLDMLDVDENFDSIDQLANSLRQLSLVRKDRGVQQSIPTDEITTIRGIFSTLPDEAKPHFLADDELRRRVNTTRRRFNEWMGRFERAQKMPGWTEAGPANYNADKFTRLSGLERSKRSELDEAIDRVRAGVNGGVRQRALEEIGSSVAEQTANQNQSKREQMRDQLESDMIVSYRSPREQVGVVIRVNKQSATISRPNPRHPGEDPLTGDPVEPYITGRQDLNSEWLTPIPKADFETERDTLTEIDANMPDTYEAAVEYLSKC